MRWPNGGPPRLYVLVVNETGEIKSFTRKRERTDWLKQNHPTYPLDMFTFLTYEQQEK